MKPERERERDRYKCERVGFKKKNGGAKRGGKGTTIKKTERRGR